MDFGDDLDDCKDTRTCSSGECLDVDQEVNNGFVDTPDLDSGDKIAQTISIRKAGTLAEIRVSENCQPPVVSLQGVAADGTPNGQQLVTVGLGHTNEFDLESSIRPSPRLAVAVNDRLALVIENGGSESCVWSGTPNDPYAGGGAFIWRASDGVWRPIPSTDMRFKLIVAR